MLGVCLSFIYGCLFRQEIFGNLAGWWPWAMLPFMLLCAAVIAGACVQSLLISEAWLLDRNLLVVNRSFLWCRRRYEFRNAKLKLFLDSGNDGSEDWCLRIADDSDLDVPLWMLIPGFLLGIPRGGVLTVRGRREELVGLARFVNRYTGWNFGRSRKKPRR
jgi:hypothetical protein